MSTRLLFCVLILVIGAVLCRPAPVYAAHESAAASAADMNPVSLSAWKTDLALWTAVVFLVLLAVMGKFAWGPITAGLDKRERGIADQIAEAEAANRQAKELLQQHEQKLAAARDEVRGILDDGRRAAERLSQDLLAKAKADAQAEQDRALKQIDDATAGALKGLADQAATLAVDLAGKIVQAKLNPHEHAKLIEQAVAGFTKQN